MLLGTKSETSKGEILRQETDGPALNCLLNGVEKTVDQIACWMRSIIAAIPENIHLPITALVDFSS